MEKYEKQLLKSLFVFYQVMEKGKSELIQNAEFISSGLMIVFNEISLWQSYFMITVSDQPLSAL